jgi:hypothetical protein
MISRMTLTGTRSLKKHVQERRNTSLLKGYKEVADLEPRHEQIESVVYRLDVKKEQSEDIVVAAVEAVEAGRCMVRQGCTPKVPCDSLRQRIDTGGKGTVEPAPPLTDQFGGRLGEC